MAEDVQDAQSELESYREQVQALRERLGGAIASLEAALAPPEPDDLPSD